MIYDGKITKTTERKSQLTDSEGLEIFTYFIFHFDMICNSEFQISVSVNTQLQHRVELMFWVFGFLRPNARTFRERLKPKCL